MQDLPVAAALLILKVFFLSSNNPEQPCCFFFFIYIHMNTARLFCHAVLAVAHLCASLEFQ